MKKIYRVGYTYSMMAYINVAAENEQDALNEAEKLINNDDFSLDDNNANYLDESIEIDKESINEI